MYDASESFVFVKDVGKSGTCKLRGIASRTAKDVYLLTRTRLNAYNAYIGPLTDKRSRRSGSFRIPGERIDGGSSSSRQVASCARGVCVTQQF